MTEPCNRLLKARTMAGYRSGRAAAAAMGVRPATYASHENGSRAFGVPEAHKYAELFDVSPGWILTGEALHQDAYTDSRRPIKPDQGAQLPEGLVDVHKFGEKVLELVAQLAPQMNVASEQTSRVLGEV
ncbi:MAG: helix-turn-helix transcriptional regulator, partial [Rhizobiales bacterium]|nr:helix-turn-helix transcriptional regulator [Hyphomicrobiales bacterium]